MNRIIFKGFLPLILITNLYASALSEPTAYSKDLYNQSILDGNYDATISKPDKFLDFNYGERVASPSQISNAISTWAKESNKLKVVELQLKKQKMDNDSTGPNDGDIVNGAGYVVTDRNSLLEKLKGLDKNGET